MAEVPFERVVTSYRRYALLKRLAWLFDLDNAAMAGVWRAKQEEQTGTSLPVGFPFLTELQAAGYSTREDLDGSDDRELARYCGFSTRDAQVVLAAFVALPP
jgi:hypothetical protein